MSARRAFLLSPYRLPTGYPVTLDDAESAAWLNGLLILWHPALLHQATEAPKVDSPYDHEHPEAGEAFAIADGPQLFQPDDWLDRVRITGAIRFKANADRQTTLDALRQAVADHQGDPEITQENRWFNGEVFDRLLALSLDECKPLLGLGFGYHLMHALFEAMDHDKVLDESTFWRHIQAAVEGLVTGHPLQVRDHCVEAARLLRAAREVLYPVDVNLLEFVALPESGELSLPQSAGMGLALNLIASGRGLVALRERNPRMVEELRAKLHPVEEDAKFEVCCGIAVEREDALLPLESQLWNLREGQRLAKEILDTEVKVLARQKFAFHPGTPQLMQAAGLRQGVLLNLTGAAMPVFRAAVVNWAGADGRSVDLLTRIPLLASQVGTYFNLASTLRQTIRDDTSPTMALLHRDEAPAPFYHDWLALTDLAPVFGRWMTVGAYLGETAAGEYVGTANADDYFADDLDQRVTAAVRDPVSGYARLARQRRLLDSAHVLESVRQILGSGDSPETEAALTSEFTATEQAVEGEGLSLGHEAAPARLLFDGAAERLARRLQTRAEEGKPGFMLLNPCSYTRRVPVELVGVAGPIPVEGPVKAAQFDGGTARLVVEVPPLGFAWIPRQGPATPSRIKLKTAEGTSIRNEFLEVEVRSCHRRNAYHPRPENTQQPPEPTVNFQPRQSHGSTLHRHHLQRCSPGRNRLQRRTPQRPQ